MKKMMSKSANKEPKHGKKHSETPMSMADDVKKKRRKKKK